MINGNVRQIGVQLAHQIPQNNRNQLTGTVAVAVVDPNTKLLSNPRSLYILWQEYTIGIGNNKAPKDFTAVECGRCKFRYCRRKVLWDIISRLVNTGLEANVAIDRIYGIYSQNLTVSVIIEQVRHDCNNNRLNPGFTV